MFSPTIESAPAVTNRHLERTAVTRRRIVEAAKLVFARDGYQAARLEEIATQAGYTRGAFYANFKDKEDLFLHVTELQIRGFTRTLLEASQAAHKLDSKCRNIVAALRNNREMLQWALTMTEFHLFAMRNPQLEKRLLDLDMWMRTDVHSVFEDLYRVAPAPPWLSPEAASLAFTAFFQGMVLQHRIHTGSISEDEMFHMMFRFLTSTLKGT